MSTTPQGLLFVLGQCEPNVPTEEFNDWYDGEHAPARLAVPGVTSATRYKAVDGEKPDWLSVYDLATPDVLKSPAYLKLYDTASENEKTIIPRLPVVQRRTYSLIAQSVKKGPLPEGALPGKYTLVVLWSISKELDSDFHKWYDEEHIDELSKVPGWLRGRRFRLIESVDLADGKGPESEGWDYLVMHDWENGGYRDTKEFIAALETPWSKKVIGSAKGGVMRDFELYRNFEPTS